MRELASTGADPHAAAVALYQEALRLLSECSGVEPPALPAPPDPSIATLARNALMLFPVCALEGQPGALTPEWLEDFHRLTKPDADHKRHGRWYTARPIARYMARRAIAELPASTEGVRILDPACGCGALLVPVFEAAVARQAALEPDRPVSEVVRETLANASAADVDAGALATASFRLRVAAARLAGAPVDARPHCFHGDSLTARPADVAPDGADILVMNPPYLGNRHFLSLPDPEHARAHLRKAFGWNDDLYAHFLHRAWDWLRPNGVLCALTSDTFLAIPSKERVRDTLRRHRLREIVRVPSSAFAAAVNTCITVATREHAELFDSVTYLDARDAPEAAWETLEAAPPPAGVQRFESPASAWAPGAPFFRPSPRAAALFERYLAAPNGADAPYRPLAEVAPAKDCGINSGNVRHRLFHAEPAPGRARLIQGRQLERYIARWESSAAQYQWVDLNYTPDPSLPGIGRGGKPSALGETWGFRGETSSHIAPRRLLLRQTEDDLFAAFIEQDPADPIYTDNTIFTLLLTDEGRALGLSWLYLLGLLNSAFLNELYHTLSQEEGRAQAQVKVGYVNRLPIAIPTDAQRREVEHWVKQAADSQRDGRPISAIQWQIDALVEALYAAETLPPADC
ncbi:MAG TPA: N-6 DNA methylase [Armatimonadota bacterium]